MGQRHLERLRRDAEAAKSSPGDARGSGQPRDPCAPGLCAAQRGARGSVLEVARLLCCAGTPRGHAKVPGAPGDSAGAPMPGGLPWLFWVRLPGITMGTVVSGHFKLDFKSQVGFKKLIQFSSLRGTDLFPRRLRKGLADLRPEIRLGPQPHLPAYARLAQGPAWSFLCREPREGHRVTFSLSSALALVSKRMEITIFPVRRKRKDCH